MTNHMEEVAKMLGVGLGEYFKIGGLYNTYVFTCSGLFNVDHDTPADDVFTKLVAGRFTIKRQPWKPKLDGTYYSIGPGGVLEQGRWLGDFIDVAMYRLGNCYRTADDAAKDRDKWIAFYASDKVLEV